MIHMSHIKKCKKNTKMFSLVYCPPRGLIFNIKIKLREGGTAPTYLSS